MMFIKWVKRDEIMGKWKGIVGYQRTYNNCFIGVDKDTAVQIDVLPIQKEQELILEFISSNSKYKQGVGLALYAGDGYIEVEGQRSKQVQIWEDVSPLDIVRGKLFKSMKEEKKIARKTVKIFCYSTEGLLSVYNIYGEPKAALKQLDSCGMLIEQVDDKFIYRCNDVGFETEFDSLVFSLKIVNDLEK